MTTRTCSTPSSDNDLADYRRALSLAFAADDEGIREWLSKAGHQNIRILKDDSNSLRAGLLLVPMGQFFGGRSVPTLGVAGVAVPPEARAQGAALEIMRAAVREARATGFPISTLYPATKSLYRKCGYEEAGLFYEASINPQLLNVRVRNDEAPPIRPFAENDRPAIRALYTRLAQNADGHLDRREYIWNRVESPREGKASGFVVHSPTADIDGYIWFTQKRRDSGKHETRITDIAAASPRAANRLLSFLSDQRSMCEEIFWRTAPASPLLINLPEACYSLHSKYEWMLRIADVKSALEARAYPASARASLNLRIDDDLIPENNATFSLTIQDSRAHVEPSSKPHNARLHTRALAALYSGHASIESLSMLDLAQAEPAAATALNEAFAPTRRAAGAAPSMPDFF